MEAYQTFLNQFRIKHFKKGEIILYQGDVPPSAFVVKSGVIKTYNLTRQGEEKPIGYDVQHEALPLAWVFSKVHRAQYYYEAFSNCEIYCVPPKEYSQFLSSNPEALLYAFQRLIERTIGFQIRINALEQSKAACKVVNTMHFLALRFGEEIKKNTVKLKIAFTQQDIANLTGLTRETTGLELKKLEHQQVITCKRRHYIIHTDRLDGLLDEEYGLGIRVPQLVL
jgi:CRP/FNR family transcriptional regulator, cyclic AMP receptor protein